MNASIKTFKRVFIFVQLFLIAFAASSEIEALTGNDVDPSFGAVVSKDVGNGLNFSLQTDGKILAFGNFKVVNGVIKSYVVRLNADGSLDDSFDCAACDFSVGSLVVQPDGEIIIAGSFFSAVTNTSVARVKKLNADGSLDSSFSSPFGEPSAQSNSFARVWAVQPDGKVLIETSSRAATSNVGQNGISRLNADGSFDTTFTTINTFQGMLSRDSISKVAVTADGKILVGINNSNGRGYLRRYDSGGASDPTFESPILTGDPFVGNNSSAVYDFDLQPDGKIVMGGLFTAVNSISRANLVRLMPAGNVDLSFVPTNVFVRSEPIVRVKSLSNGQNLVSTGMPFSGIGPPAGNGNRFFRFNADGSHDSTLTSPGNLTLIVDWDVDAANRILVYGGFLDNGQTTFRFARLNTDGSIGEYLNAYFGIESSVTTLAVQPDGKILLAGDFSRVNGVPRQILARVNADGSLDSTFNFSTIVNPPITKIAVQPDGKILIAGSFTVNGLSNLGLVRVNADGSLDTSFSALLPTSVYAIAVQADGKILIGGSFGGVNSELRVGLARLNSDGTTDASFNSSFGGNTVIRSIFLQPDGKIMVGGSFNAVGGFARSNLVRLNADGSLDSSFNAGNIASVGQVERQANGKYIVLAGGIVRLNDNGTTDTSFQSVATNGTINAFLIQPDGTIVIGGNFTRVNNVARANLTRLRPNGTLDTGFFSSGANNQIRAVVKQSDGRILVGGDFSHIGGVPKLGIARLNVAPYRLITPFDYDGDGRADVAVFRPANGNWYILPSQTNAFYGFPFGQAGDQIAPADYDGDGKTDVAIFREIVPGAGNFAYFYILNSSDGSFRPVQFGATGDVPMAGDWDGDGKGDLAVYRAASAAGGQSYFYYRPSSQPTVDYNTIPLGTAGDKPLLGDFDGDGRLDPAVFRPSTATWIILKSSLNQITQTAFGVSTDIPTPADFDGDGITNIAVFRPSNGTWYTSQSPQTNFGAIVFGANGDVPVPADYDGDGRADAAVFRPSNGAWYLNRTTSGFTGVQFGTVEDKPVPNAFIR